MPNVNSTQCKVRISDVSNSSLIDTSDRFFAIISLPINPCPGEPTIIYLGKTYNTVKIGEQCWLRENLNIGTRINGSQNQINNGTLEKYCYNDDEKNCDMYGGLYQWDEAMQYTTIPNSQGICPKGWHIPSLTEYEVLQETVNNSSNALKELGQGSGSGIGTNTSGFSVLLAGYRFYFGSFYDLDNSTVIWSSTEDINSTSYYLGLTDFSNDIGLSPNSKGNGFSVRCLKDTTQTMSLQLTSPNGGENWQVDNSS